MTGRSRLLVDESSPPPRSRNSSPMTEPIDSDFVVILAVLLCALICVLGLIAVSRCAWIRRIIGNRDSSSNPPPAAADGNTRGLTKKDLESLPKLTYSEENEVAAKLHDCVICLAEFSAGEEIRLLPRCGHGFHVSCIDTWLGSHASCPSCRQILEASRCGKCGSLPPATACSAVGLQPEIRESQTSIGLSLIS